MPLHGFHNYGIIGLASFKGRVAIVSTHRVTKKNEWKAILHEFCHTRGLAHCNDNRCIMAAGRGIGYFSGKHSFCEKHEQEIKKALGKQ